MSNAVLDFSTKKRNAPKIGKTKPSLSEKDQRLSVCSDCRFGIFIGHRYEWTTRGLIHINCEDKRLLDEIKNST